MRLILLCLMIWGASIPLAQAFERAAIADRAEDVTPLLNGQSIPQTTLKLADGSPVSLTALTMQKPSIVLFYRGGWCPYCNRQLAELKDIEQELVSLGYQVLAISPESPSRLQEQKLETEFAVTLLSDVSLDTIRNFGIGFYVEQATSDRYLNEYGIDLTEDKSMRSVLPAPAIFFVDTQGVVQFNYVNPNFRVRPSAELILNVAKVLKP
ncbi:peroxiredoxin-like family protein [Alteromonas facilis]|uniref:peroxiredoxin-like family protein n=1 Tax=Alteromonas facilis TaxID=2048004 RepID=UPI000C28A6B5|nr:peroxiredoxin-like family protein [Alteromonas facilis]